MISDPFGLEDPTQYQHGIYACIHLTLLPWYKTTTIQWEICAKENIRDLRIGS